jgi:hypothetical protein
MTKPVPATTHSGDARQSLCVVRHAHCALRSILTLVQAMAAPNSTSSTVTAGAAFDSVSEGVICRA